MNMKYLLFVFLMLSSVPAEAITLKIATLSPDGSSWMKSMRQAAKRIEDKTQGRVKIKFYTGGTMGNDQAVLRRMRARQLHGGAITSSSLANRYSGAQLYTLPMLFADQQEVDKVRAVLDKELMQGFEDSGFVVFGFAGGGFAYLMSKNKLTSLASIQQSKVWIPSNDPAAEEIVKAFDISPIPLALGDVLPSLQTGIIDTVATSPIAAIALQWHTQVKYVIDLPILYIYAFLTVDKKAFNKLKQIDQQIFREEMTATFEQIDQHNRKENQDALEALKAFGIEFIKPDNELVTSWRKKAKQVAPKLIAEDKLDKALFEKTMALLHKIRSDESNQ